MPGGAIVPYMIGGWKSWKDRRGKTSDGPRENWRPSVSTVKAVIKFVIATNKVVHNIESETGSIDEQRREMDDRVAGAAQAS